MQATNFDEKVKYFSTIQEPIVKEKPSVMNLVSRFEQQAQPKPDDHAIVDEVDVRKLSVILGHEPEHRSTPCCYQSINPHHLAIKKSLLILT